MTNWFKPTYGIDLWENRKTGELVSISGTEDKAWYVVRRTYHRPQWGYAPATVLTKDLSPYFILHQKPVGAYGKASNQTVRATRKWMYGTKGDAARFALEYMRRHE